MSNLAFKVLCASLATVGVEAAGLAQPLYGVMFRTGGQTSGLNPILYDVNPLTGAATGPRNVNVNDCVGIALDPTTGVMYGLTDQFGRINNISGQGGKNLVFTIDPATGAAAAVGRLDPTGVFQEFEGDLAFNPVDGTFWGVSTLINSARLFTINKSTGLATLGATLLPVIGTDLDISALAFDAAGSMYVLDTRYPNNPGPALIEQVNPATGQVLQTWNTGVPLGNVAGMSFDAQGQLFIADGDTSGTNKLYRFDFESGTLNEVGPTGAAGGIYQGLAGLVFSCAPVITQQPAPATICGAGGASFTIAAASTGTAARQWRFVDPDTGAVRVVAEGVNYDSLNSPPAPLFVATGAGAGTLRIDPPGDSSHWNFHVWNEIWFRCVVSSPCGSITSEMATLTIHRACNLADITTIGGTAEAPGCPDALLTVDDVILFVNLFSDSAGCPGLSPCSVADVCGIGGPPEAPDGQLTVDDIIAFVNAFSEGC